MSLTDIFNRKARDGGEEQKPAPPTHDSVFPRIRDVDFSQMPRLEGADLSGADLRGADLRSLAQRQEERTRAKRLWALKQMKKNKT